MRAKRDALDKALLVLLTGNLIFAGISIFKDKAKGLSEDQLLQKLEEAQRAHHKTEKGN